MSERCESGCDPKIAPVVIHDSEGIPLCIGCWNSMMFDAHRKEVIRFRNKIRRLEVALRRCVDKHRKDPR